MVKEIDVLHSKVNMRSEKTEVIYGSENIINRALEGLSKAKKRFDNCSDESSPSAYISTKRM